MLDGDKSLLNATDHAGRTALHMAAANSHALIVALLGRHSALPLRLAAPHSSRAAACMRERRQCRAR